MVSQHNREYELKLMLSRDEYTGIEGSFRGHEIIQVNHYFDTQSFDLYKRKIVVRLRQKVGSYEITVKTANQGTSAEGVVDMSERTIIIDETEAMMLLDGRIPISNYLIAFKDIPKGDYVEVGIVRTGRKVIEIHPDLPPAELDMSIYNGITDYELEWELDEDNYAKAVAVLGDMGINLEGRSLGLSKYGRLVKSLSKGI
jgi:uncharacterized protein YjbK